MLIPLNANSPENHPLIEISCVKWKNLFSFHSGIFSHSHDYARIRPAAVDKLPSPSLLHRSLSISKGDQVIWAFIKLISIIFNWIEDLLVEISRLALSADFAFGLFPISGFKIGIELTRAVRLKGKRSGQRREIAESVFFLEHWLQHCSMLGN